MIPKRKITVPGSFVSYGGKIYAPFRVEGRPELFLKPQTGWLKGLRTKRIVPKHVVTMPEAIYNELKKEVEWKRKERVGVWKGITFLPHGVLKGEKREVSVVRGFERIPLNVLQVPEHVIIPKGGTVASSKTESHVKKIPGAIGLYHTHPTSDKLSPADKTEIKRIDENFPGLKKVAGLHILARGKGIVGLGTRARKTSELIAYFYKKGKFYKIPINVLR